MRIKVKVEGVSPLVMHRFCMDEPDKKMKKQKVYIPEEEAEKSAYRDENGKLCMLAKHFKTAMVKAGTDFKFEGKKTYKEYLKAGIVFEKECITLNQQKYELYSCPVVIGRARIIRTRPRIKEWSCEFVFEIIDDNLNKSIVKEILENAGKYKGIGDERPEYGRFKVIEYTEIK